MYAQDRDHLNDLIQETLANIWAGLPKFRQDSKPSTWIYRITLNTCITFFRRHGKHSSMERLDEKAFGIADDNLERQQNLRTMYELISRLDKMERAIIMMWLDEHSYDEISAVTGLSRNNVASRLHRIKHKLQKMNNL